MPPAAPHHRAVATAETPGVDAEHRARGVEHGHSSCRRRRIRLRGVEHGFDATGTTPTGGGSQAGRSVSAGAGSGTTTITTTHRCGHRDHALEHSARARGAQQVHRLCFGGFDRPTLGRSRRPRSSAGEVTEPKTSTSRSRHATNWSRSLADTSAITPRPNWATLPVIVTSVSMLTTGAVAIGLQNGRRRSRRVSLTTRCRGPRLG